MALFYLKSKLSHLKVNLLHRRFLNVTIFPRLANNSDMITKHSLVIKGLINKASKFKHWGVLAIVMGTICVTRVEKVPYSEQYHLFLKLPKMLETLTDRKVPYSDQYFFPEMLEILTDRRKHVREQLVGLYQRHLENDPGYRGVWPSSNCHYKHVGSVVHKILKAGCRVKHMQGRKWKLVVVDSLEKFSVLVFSDRNTTAIVVYKPSSFDVTDDKLAFFLAQEIGHSIARQVDVRKLKQLFVICMGCIISCCHSSATLLLRLILRPITVAGTYQMLFALFPQWLMRDELFEADHIGMMLMASAGYDPRNAPTFIRELCSSDNPNRTERAKSMEDKMGKAIAVYNEFVGSAGALGSGHKERLE